MTKSKRIAAVGVLVSGLALAGSVYALGSRIARYNEAHPPKIFYAQAVLAPALEFEGRTISIEPDVDEEGRGVLRIVYGSEAVLDLDVKIPQPNVIPGLARFQDWFNIIRFIEASAGESSEDALASAAAGERRARLVIVERIPRLEANEGLGLIEPPDNWGWQNVQRKNWFFGFHEFLPDGSIESTELRFPTTKRDEEPADGELRQGTWQYDLAMQVMPKGAAPKHNFTERALVNAGWTFGASGVSVMLFLGSLAVLLAPARADRTPGA